MWDENDAEDGPEPGAEPKQYVDVDTLDDGRCKASTYRDKQPAKTTYESLFGRGGYNRCIGGADHPNPLHKDEWGHVFRLDEGGFRVVRNEPTNPNPPEVMI